MFINVKLKAIGVDQVMTPSMFAALMTAFVRTQGVLDTFAGALPVHGSNLVEAEGYPAFCIIDSNRQLVAMTCKGVQARILQEGVVEDVIVTIGNENESFAFDRGAAAPILSGSKWAILNCAAKQSGKTFLQGKMAPLVVIAGEANVPSTNTGIELSLLFEVPVNVGPLSFWMSSVSGRSPEFANLITASLDSIAENAASDVIYGADLFHSSGLLNSPGNAAIKPLADLNPSVPYTISGGSMNAGTYGSVIVNSLATPWLTTFDLGNASFQMQLVAGLGDFAA